ncbi:ABC transporter ATP-binding protein [Variovorax sp. LjRoot178]|uniref:ABC transporter ATP-binding protein n=1 Tax=Variovorax sp. LjRoot178 TaxID=3342277 RepID=UPI003ED1529F
MSDAILVLEDVNACYGKSHVLHGVSMHVNAGEIVSVLGRNGMGKTTTMRTIVGLLRVHAGSVRFEGVDLAGMAVDDIARRGISLVPAHRGIFTLLSVQENLQIAQRKHAVWTLDRVYDEFPRLRERRRNLGGALSGGEQQMLAIARALVQGPRLLLLDEPTEGLAPVIVDELTELIRGVGASGIPIVLVEQSFAVCRALAQRHYILEEGVVVYEGRTEDLDADASVLERFLGLDVDAH